MFMWILRKWWGSTHFLGLSTIYISVIHVSIGVLAWFSIHPLFRLVLIDWAYYSCLPRFSVMYITRIKRVVELPHLALGQLTCRILGHQIIANLVGERFRVVERSLYGLCVE